MNLKNKYLACFSMASIFAFTLGCSPIISNGLGTDSLGRSFCPPGPYDKSNINGRYYVPSVDKCVEGKVFQKDHELCIRGPYNTGQFDLAINYNPTVDQCVVGIVIPITSGVCLVWDNKNIVAREYSINSESCKDGKVVSKRPL